LFWSSPPASALEGRSLSNQTAKTSTWRSGRRRRGPGSGAERSGLAVGRLLAGPADGGHATADTIRFQGSAPGWAAMASGKAEDCTSFYPQFESWVRLSLPGSTGPVPSVFGLKRSPSAGVQKLATALQELPDCRGLGAATHWRCSRCKRPSAGRLSGSRWPGAVLKLPFALLRHVVVSGPISRNGWSHAIGGAGRCQHANKIELGAWRLALAGRKEANVQQTLEGCSNRTTRTGGRRRVPQMFLAGAGPCSASGPKLSAGRRMRRGRLGCSRVAASAPTGQLSK